MILCNTDAGLDVEKSYINKLHKHLVDGYVLTTAFDSSIRVAELYEVGRPLVIMVRGVENSMNLDYVVVNNFKSHTI